jgi:hypothetical protein
MLNLLTLLFKSVAEQESSPSLRLLFSGGMEIDLKIDELFVKIHDFQHPWPTQKQPIHIHDHMLKSA